MSSDKDALRSSTRAAWRAVAPAAAAFLAAQVVGSVFNIWYNLLHVRPLLNDEQRDVFATAVAAFNGIVYPAALVAWFVIVGSLVRPYAVWLAGGDLPEDEAETARRRTINLTWWGLGLAAMAWTASIPALLIPLTWTSDLRTDAAGHLAVSLLIGGAIAVPLGCFACDYLARKDLYPIAFASASAWRTPGAVPLGLIGRELLQSIAACVAPAICLLLICLSPGSGQWFPISVAGFAVCFGLAAARMSASSVREPIIALERAAHEVADGRYDTRVSLARADEFGPLIEEFNAMAAGLAERERMRTLFGRHVGRQVAARILADNPDLEPVEQRAAVMFADIRGFTTHCAGASASEVVRWLNDFFTEMTDVIEDGHGGWVDKFLGDGLLAVFGLQETEATPVATALVAAEAMFQRLNQFNLPCGRARPRLEIGVGLHYGPVVVGAIGSSRRQEFTTIGATVNLAARVQDLTKQLGRPLLLTEAAAQVLNSPDTLEPLGSHAIRGLTEPVSLYSPIRE